MERIYRLVLATVLSATPSFAHDPGLSSSRLTLRADRIDAWIAFNSNDVARLVVAADLDRDGRISARELDAGRDVLVDAFGREFELRVDDETLEPTHIELREGDDGDVEFRIEYPRGPGTDLNWRVDTVSRMPRGHRQYAGIVDASGKVFADALLRRGRTTLRAAVDRPRDPWQQTFEFFELGVEHILIGYDHILFLLAVLLLGGTMRSIVAVITSFTVAHSITLGLATLDVVHLPGGLVEAVIAASIVWVGVENLVRRTPRQRWRTTFLFGLVHGFGFASVLADLGIASAGGVAVPLAAFNVGVEAGQVAIAAVALPCLAWVRRTSVGRPVLLTLSAAIVAAGAFWLVERTLFA